MVRAGALGDVLLLRRAVFALKSAGHHVTLLAPAASGAALLGPGTGEADALLAWDSPELAALLTDSGVGEGPLRRQLARFDLALACTRNATLLRSLGGLIPRVIARDPWPAGCATHASVWLAEALAEFAPEASDPPTLAPAESDRREAEPWLRRLPSSFLVIHPGSGSPAKNWPEERFARLAELRGAGRPWLLVLGPAEAETRLRAAAGAIVCDTLPVRPLAALLARAGLYVGNDSGVSHLAAAAGAPTLCLFGPTDPAVWAPLGPRVRTLRARDGRIASLELAEVLDAAR